VCFVVVVFVLFFQIRAGVLHIAETDYTLCLENIKFCVKFYLV